MAYVKLRMPAGVSSNGTKYQSIGRWYVANLVRWFESAMQPIGGWTKAQDSTPANLDLTNPIRGMHGWKSNANAAHLALATYNKQYAFVGGTLTDITDPAFTAGTADAGLTVGNYGAGNYGDGPYGGGTESGGVLTEAGNMVFDNFGEILVGVAASDGIIYDWDLNASNNLTAIAAAPTSTKALVVTPERFLVGLAVEGNARKVAWSDKEDRTTWTASDTNQAGDFTLPGKGDIQCGRRVRTDTLIWTDNGLFAMRFIGGTLVYSFVTLGENCGITSRRAVAVVDGRAIWMGHRNFFLYDGFVQPIPCSISDAVFGDINRVQISKVSAVENTDFNEIWFCYPSGSSIENDKVAVYNYVENHWSGPWDLKRTDGVGRATFGYPVLGGPLGGVYYHERDVTYLDTDDATALVPSAESGPVEIGQGDQTMMISRVIPDEANLADVAVTLYASDYPTSTERSQSVSSTAPTSSRLSGRWARLKIAQTNAKWRVGDFRLDLKRRGRR